MNTQDHPSTATSAQTTLTEAELFAQFIDARMERDPNADLLYGGEYSYELEKEFDDQIRASDCPVYELDLCVSELRGYADRLAQMLTEFRLLAEPLRIKPDGKQPHRLAERAKWFEARARAEMEPSYRRPTRANIESSLMYGAILSSMR